MADEIAGVSIKVDTKDVERGAATLETLAVKGERVEKSLDGVERSAQRTGKSLASLGGEAARPIEQVGTAARTSARDLERLADAGREASSAIGSQTGMAGAFGVAKTAALAFAGAFTVTSLVALSRQYLTIADTVTNLTTQLRLSEGSIVGAARAYEGLFAVAQRARVSFADLASTYAQVRRATSDLGVSAADTLRITETLAKAITISGVSAQSAQAAMVQLSQGLASGTLRGEELNSILEQTPRVARALADGLGVSIGQLRELGQTGQLTGERVAAALLKASEAIDREFGQSLLTVGQATTTLGNSLTNLIGTLDNATGTSANVARLIVTIASAIDSVTSLASRLINGPQAAQIDATGNDAITLRRSAESAAALKAAETARRAVAEYAQANANLSREQRRQAELSKALTEFSGVVKGFAQDSAEYATAYGALQQRIANIDRQFAQSAQARTRAVPAIDREAIAAAKALEDAYLGVLGVTRDYIPTLERLNTLFESGRITQDQYVEAVERLALAQPGARQAVQALAESARAQIDLQRQIAAEQARAFDAAAQSNDALRQSLAAETERVATLGLSARALQDRTLAQLDDVIASREAVLVDLELNGESETRIALLREEIDLLRQRRQVMARGFERQNDIDRRNEIAQEAINADREWARTADNIERALTDSLFRAAESGKSAFETLRDSIKGIFANLVLRPIISATIGTITGALGLTGSAAAQTLGAVGGASSGISALSGIGGLASLGGSIGMFGSGFASGLTAWGAGGSVTGLLGSGSALFAGGIANGLGVIAGALGPIALGVGLIVSLLGEGGGPKSGGSFSSSDVIPRTFTPDDADASVAAVGESIRDGLDNLSRRLRVEFDNIDFALGFDTDPQGKAGSRVASIVRRRDTGEFLLDNFAGRSVDSGKISEELGVEAQRILLAALQGVDLGDGLSEIINRLDPATAAPQAIDNLLKLADSIVALGRASENLPGVMGSVATLSATAREELIGFAGGLDALLTNQQTYLNEFFTVAERYQVDTANLSRAFSEIGISLEQVDTRGEFRAVVEAIDLTTESGRQLYASILALAGPLSQWIAQTELLGASVSQPIALPTDQEVEAWFAAILTPTQNAQRQLQPIAQDLADALGVSVETALGLTAQDIAAWAAEQQAAWTSLTDAQRQTLVSVIRLTPEFLRLSEAARPGATAIDAFYASILSPAEDASRRLGPISESLASALGVSADALRELSGTDIIDWVEEQLPQWDRLTRAQRDSLTTVLELTPAFMELLGASVSQPIALPTDQEVEAWFAAILTPTQNAQRQLQPIAQDLADALGVSVETALGLTAQDIAAWAAEQQAAWTSLTDAQRQTLVSVIRLTPEFLRLSEAARPGATAIDAFYASILSPAEDASRRLGPISESLASALGVSADALRELSGTDIIDWVEEQLPQWDRLTQAQRDSLTTVLELTPAFMGLTQTLDDLARSDAIEALQDQADAMIATYGDLEGAMQEIEPAAANLVDAWRANIAEIDSLESALAQLTGTIEQTPIERLGDMVRMRDSIGAYRDQLSDALFDAMLEGLPLEQQAAQLWQAYRQALASIEIAEDPTEAASRAQRFATRAIAIDAQIRQQPVDPADTAALQQQTALAKDARELQIATLRDQIDGLRTIVKYAERLRKTAFELRVGDLSALNPATQLDIALGEFQRLAGLARSGDAEAFQQIGGVAQSALRAARGVYASGTGYASIFGDVTGTLDALGLAGGPAMEQASALQAQLDALSAIDISTADTATNSAETVAVLTAIDAALAAREAALNVAINDLVTEVRGQIAELRRIADGQEAEIRQHAAAYRALIAAAEATATGIDTMVGDSALAAAAPTP